VASQTHQKFENFLKKTQKMLQFFKICKNLSIFGVKFALNPGDISLFGPRSYKKGHFSHIATQTQKTLRTREKRVFLLVATYFTPCIAKSLRAIMSHGAKSSHFRPFCKKVRRGTNIKAQGRRDFWCVPNAR
jgi:hypothetical protein